jgi:GDP-L-fucose synthase
MPTNLYGPGDNYHPENSHVIPALLRRFHEAKISNTPEVMIWGTGTSRREFLYVDDMARACVFVMELAKEQYDQATTPMQSHLNIGYGSDVTINELAHAVAKTIGYQGRIEFEPSKPDGSPRKWMSSERLNQLDWRPEYHLEDGLGMAYLDFCSQQNLLTKFKS